jgi:hypothetical protein
MKSATKSQYTQVLAWLIWIIVLVVLIRAPEGRLDGATSELPALTGGLTSPWRDGALFHWKYRLRVVIRRRRRALRSTCQRVLWATRLVKLALRGALTMAQVVDWLTRSQLRRHLGALPVLYGLLEVLQVREIINRHCPTAAEVEHGTVALVLVLNRLVASRRARSTGWPIGWPARCWSTNWACPHRSSMMTAWGGPWTPSANTVALSGKTLSTKPCCGPTLTCRSSFMI